MSDHSSSTWVSLFDEQAQKLLGATAQQLFELRASGNNDEYERIFANALFKKFIVRV